jgi:hypothetical protein
MSARVERWWRRFPDVQDMVERAFRADRWALRDVCDCITSETDSDERDMIATAIREQILKLPRKRGRPPEDVEPIEAEFGSTFAPEERDKQAEFWAAYNVRIALLELRKLSGRTRLRWISGKRRIKDKPMKEKLIDDAIRHAEEEAPELKGKLKRSHIKTHLDDPKKLLSKGSRILYEINERVKLPRLDENYEYVKGKGFRDRTGGPHLNRTK